MHIITRRPRAVTLFAVTGEVRRFTSLLAARKHLGLAWITHNVRPQFHAFNHTAWPTQRASTRLHATPIDESSRADSRYEHARYVMRDDFGEAITGADFVELESAGCTDWIPSHLRYWNGEGPVPRTGLRRGRSCYRRVRHMNARRGAETFHAEGEVSPRAARDTGRLPNPWDDYKESSYGQRNWKRFRKHQWK